jgi:transcriptional regulator
MARKWNAIAEETMGAERRAVSKMRAKAMLAEMHLADLRRARELSQVELAKKIGTTQPEISKIESRADMYVSTLRKYIEAAGGRLEIVAYFNDGRDVRISQLSEMAAG